MAWLHGADAYPHDATVQVHSENPGSNDLVVDLDAIVPATGWAAIDVVGVCVRQTNTDMAGLGVTFQKSVEKGAHYLSGDEGWNWEFGVDLHNTWQASHLFAVTPGNPPGPDTEPVSYTHLTLPTTPYV